LTALKKYDNYTFTHMVNVAALSMAQARALNIEGPLLREFGFAALMHDIGKVNTPLEVLNKPGKLERNEFDVMKQHVVDGAHILRRTPEMPALAPIVAFEHHLKQDLSGYPEKIGTRKLNLCTMIVSIADVFDALRSNRPYREGMATVRIRSIMGEQGNPAFNQVLLKRFVNLMGLFPVGTLVRLTHGEIAVVTAEHPTDPFRPQVKIIVDRDRSVDISLMAELTDAPAPLDAADTARLTDFARACKAAARAVVLYPSGHPAIAATLGRIAHITGPAAQPVPLKIRVLPDGLLLDERPPARGDAALSELAVLLHSHLIGEMTIHPGGDVE